MLKWILIIVIGLSLAQITYQKSTTRTLQTYTTDPERTKTVKARCGSDSRSDLLDFAEKFDRSTVENAMSTIWTSFEQYDHLLMLVNPSLKKS